MDYLIEESPLTVLPTLAVAIGLHESMIVQQVQYWISINKKEGRNYIDGKYWTYNTADDSKSSSKVGEERLFDFREL